MDSPLQKIPASASVSVLIPTYNHVCVPLVGRLLEQARACGLGEDRFEVVVADDASTDERAKEANRAVAQWPCCRLIELPENVGRSKIRNLLCRAARQEYLLYFDCDVLPLRDDLLLRYLREQDAACGVVYGGVALPASPEMARDNLRYRYETACLWKFSAERRNRIPYKNFRSINFMARRSVMEAFPFNERVRRYGHEDVLWGKCLAENAVAVRHIDNPVLVDDFEPNGLFLDKTEEGLRTLCEFEDELRDYSGLIALSDRLRRLHLRGLARGLFRPLRPWLHRRLCGSRPSVFWYNVYRMGRFLQLRQRD